MDTYSYAWLARDAGSQTSYSLACGYTQANSEDEARGVAMRVYQKNKPGGQLLELMVLKQNRPKPIEFAQLHHIDPAVKTDLNQKLL